MRCVPMRWNLRRTVAICSHMSADTAGGHSRTCEFHRMSLCAHAAAGTVACLCVLTFFCCSLLATCLPCGQLVVAVALQRPQRHILACGCLDLRQQLAVVHHASAAIAVADRGSDMTLDLCAAEN